MYMNRTINNCSSSCNLTSDYVTIYQVPTSIIVLLSVLYGSISVIAVVGNFMVVWIVASSKSMQNVTNCFICNLALADIVIGFFAIPFEVSLVFIITFMSAKSKLNFFFLFFSILLFSFFILTKYFLSFSLSLSLLLFIFSLSINLFSF
ncbi:lymnokinin receptor, putative [Pediculus humanus corporis]|uniref:Lymnokinin receptor, putative n=1 Tax=Pediculus humanus subsp. corporis TaxID=121224 RepID=E0VGI7_PEDHC|nr:lymnokinin receptor, putative [Pediculus humanus corporis]EEB12493.1 lymnokinin receptor, putative [Pediculus humanus corporis]